MPGFEPASDDEERWLKALERQNLARRRAWLDVVVSHATLDFVASLRHVLQGGGYDLERLLADWCEMEAGALRLNMRARRLLVWATRRTRKTLHLLGRNS